MRLKAALLLPLLLAAEVSAQGDPLPRRAWFGASLAATPDASGVITGAVTPGSPAAEAGLLSVDRRVRLGGTTVRTPGGSLPSEASGWSWR